MEFRGVSIDALLAPLSHQKVIVLLEVIDPVLAEQHDFFCLIVKRLGAVLDMRVRWEEFCKSGYLVAGAPLTQASEGRAGQLIDFFRQAKFKNVVKASWYSDGHLVEHSGDGLSTYDLLTDIVGTGNFIIVDSGDGFHAGTKE